MPTTRGAWEAKNVNAFETQLTSQANALDLTFFLQSTTGLQAPFYMVLDPDDSSAREYVYVDGNITSTTVVTTDIANRYLDGSADTSGLAHIAGTKVRIVPTAQHFQDIWDAIDLLVDTDYSSGTKGTIKTSAINSALADITVSQIAADSLTTESEGITNQDDDVHIPTNAAVKDMLETPAMVVGNKELKAYKETTQTLTSSSGVVAIDMANGNTGVITLTENITDIDFTNVPTSGVSTFTLQITQHASSDKTVAINAVTVNSGSNVTALTPGAAGFTMTTGASKVDLLTFLFVDAGTPLLNSLQDFS